MSSWEEMRNYREMKNARKGPVISEKLEPGEPNFRRNAIISCDQNAFSQTTATCPLYFKGIMQSL